MGVADELRQGAPTPGGETAIDAPPRSAGHASATPLHRALRSGGVHWALLVVLGLYAASAFVVPTLTSAAVSDDFLYARSVDILVSDRELLILPASAATVVFQVGWGAIFSFVFGHSFGVLRASTVIFTLGSSLAVYGLCRELRLDKLRSALGAAVFLFSPLGYVLSFTFMTDRYFVGLLAISAFLYARGLNDENRERWVVAGSVAAALAFLVRHQGIPIPLGVLTYLVASGRLRRDRPSLRLTLQVLLVPAVTAAVYLLWFRFIHGMPENSAQSRYFDAWLDAGFSDITGLIRRVFFIEVMFLGLFALPFGLAAVPRLPSIVRSTTRSAWLAFGAIIAAAAAAAATFGPTLRMPYVPQFLSTSGLGPGRDLHGGRLPTVGTNGQTLVTVACAIAAFVLILALCRRLPLLKSPANAAAGVVLGLLLWQAIGVVAVSMELHNTSISYDRYFLPLLPLVVCAGLWALRDVGLNLPIAVVVTACLAVFSVAATHDFLEYQGTTWRVARAANDAGVPYDRLDGGAAWDGHHLYEFSYENEIKPTLPKNLGPGPLLLSPHDVSPWWLFFYAPAVQIDYVISAEPLTSFTVLRRVEYSSWLQDDPTYIYLLRHPDATPRG
jgi:4-amino-4-deoxy-L-arabinose transferase-like glycosyltransferase